MDTRNTKITTATAAKTRSTRTLRPALIMQGIVTTLLTIWWLAPMHALAAPSPISSPSTSTGSPHSSLSSSSPGASGWNTVPSPNQGPYNNFLQGVAAIAPDDVWAVGYHAADDYAIDTLTMHWDGQTWNIEPSPNPGGTGNSALNVLLAADGASPNDVWAVGHYGLNEKRNLAMHWNGQAWLVTDTPNLGTGLCLNSLTSVAAISLNDVWAAGTSSCVTSGVGTNVTMHWDGSTWTMVDTPNILDWQGHNIYNTLTRITALSPTDVWGVGRAGSLENSRTLTMHWDGSLWTIVPAPQIRRSGLAAVGGVSSNDVWGVGGDIMHWDGAQWSSVPWPNPYPPGYNSPMPLSSVVAISSNNVWAAGTYTPLDHPSQLIALVLHWDGAAWRRVDALEATNVQLRAIAPTWGSDPQIWGVGWSTSVGALPYQTLTIRCQTCAVASTPTSTPTSTSMPTLTATLTATLTPTSLSSSTATPASGLTPLTTVTAVTTATSISASPSTSPTTTASATTIATATTTPIACLIPFSDVQPQDYFYESVSYLYCSGSISGYSDGTFRPGSGVTRGQTVKIAVGAFGLSTGYNGEPHFTDVPAGSTFYPYVEAAYQSGLISGYSDGTFRPNSPVTRGQVAKIVVLSAARTDGWDMISPSSATFSDVPPDSAFYLYVETAYSHRVLSGYSDGTFRAGSPATRGQLAKVTFLALGGNRR